MRRVLIPLALIFSIAIPARSTTAQTSASPSAQGAGQVRFTDAAGRTVVLEAPPRRLVVVGKGPHLILHMLYMFPEGPARIVALEKRGRSTSDFLEAIDPGFKNIKTLGINPGPEEIAALRPDLVLIKGSTAERTGEALAGIGIPTAYLSMETPDEFYRDLTNLGIIMGNEARAVEITAFYRGRVERVQKAVSGTAADKRPRVLILMATDRGGKYAVQVPAAGWMQTYQAKTAGGVPVWLDAAKGTSGWTVVNMEQIAVWNPDKVFVVIWHTIDPQTLIDALKTDPQWGALTAVKSGGLFAFPQDFFGWDSPDPRWILGLTWLAARIHPELFEGLDFPTVVREFYLNLYGLDPASVDRIILPKVRLNVR